MLTDNRDILDALHQAVSKVPEEFGPGRAAELMVYDVGDMRQGPYEYAGCRNDPSDPDCPPDCVDREDDFDIRASVAEHYLLRGWFVLVLATQSHTEWGAQRLNWRLWRRAKARVCQSDISADAA